MAASSPEPRKPYRVVQWATGMVGGRALRAAIEHPDIDVVGCWVHSASKAGRDVGELVGLPPIGVTATNDADEVLALEPDCVLYMPHEFDADEVCRILESGANVVSTRMELQNPVAFDTDMAERIQKACLAGGTSVHATGSSPGFISEALPIVMSSIQRRFDFLEINEFADCSQSISAQMLFELVGVGKKPGESDHTYVEHVHDFFAPSLQLLATAMGVPFDGFRTDFAVATARHDVQCEGGVVAAGTVGAARSTLTCLRRGQPLMSFTTNWFVTDDVDTPDGDVWEFRKPAGWHVVLTGDCPLDISIAFPTATLDEYWALAPKLTSNRPVNAVPFVCDALPGIRTILDLPHIIPRLA